MELLDMLVGLDGTVLLVIVTAVVVAFALVVGDSPTWDECSEGDDD